MNSNTLSVVVSWPLIGAMTLSSVFIPTGTRINYISNMDYQTTSVNIVAEEYGKRHISDNPQAEAAQLFGPQSNFTPDELQTYKAVLMRKAEDVGINLFDLF